MVTTSLVLRAILAWCSIINVEEKSHARVNIHPFLAPNVFNGCKLLQFTGQISITTVAFC